MWLGLDKLHSLTSQKSYTLQITMTDFDGEKYVAVYEQFQVRTFQALQNTSPSPSRPKVYIICPSVCVCLILWLIGLDSIPLFIVYYFLCEVVCNHRYSGVMCILMPIGSVGDICGADFAGSNDSMEMYPAILMHILVWNLGKPLWNKEYWIPSMIPHIYFPWCLTKYPKATALC